MGLIADEQPAMYKVIEAAGLAHGKSMQSYLCMMSVRLLEMRRVFKESGSIYLHCDPTASHYLKLLMDSIYGARNFTAEIIWKRTSEHSDSRTFGNVSDTILLYGDHININDVRVPYEQAYVDRFCRYDDNDGRGPCTLDNMNSPSPRPNWTYEWLSYQPPSIGGVTRPSSPRPGLGGRTNPARRVEGVKKEHVEETAGERTTGEGY